jgi:hypothetical protein
VALGLFIFSEFFFGNRNTKTIPNYAPRPVALKNSQTFSGEERMKTVGQLTTGFLFHVR